MPKISAQNKYRAVIDEKYRTVCRCIVTENNYLFSLLPATFSASTHRRIVHFTTRSVIRTQYCLFSRSRSCFFPSLFCRNSSGIWARSCSKNLFAIFSRALDRTRKRCFYMVDASCSGTLRCNVLFTRRTDQQAANDK